MYKWDKARMLWSHQNWIYFHPSTLQILSDGGDLIIGQIGCVVIMQLQQTLQLIFCLITNMLENWGETKTVIQPLTCLTKAKLTKLTCSGVRFFQFSHLCFQSGPTMSPITDSATPGGKSQVERHQAKLDFLCNINARKYTNLGVKLTACNEACQGWPALM